MSATNRHWRPKLHKYGMYRVMDGNKVLADHIGSDDDEGGKRNAALFAAAPKLLECLKSLLAMNACRYDRDTEEYRQTEEKAREVIREIGA